ncbi:MAG: META and DUF4377 domain-containing protein [Acidobacteria bacterium]|nr:META and DUF4377 domain-containing protein [Acidobacteriota bacterium]MCW5948187.1 META and DUF4377 domain-containing protein [Pyrinomonadaceae bacterium]
MHKLFASIMLAVLAVASAAAQTKVSDDWQLVSYKFAGSGNISLDGKTITLTVDTAAGRISGNSGCNRYTGPMRFDDAGRLKVGPLAATMMACPPPWMQFEKQFLQTLEAADSFSFETGVLTVTDTDTQNFLRFKRVDKPEIFTWYVNKEAVDCVGVVKTKCLQVKDRKDAPWQNFFGPIAGFDFKKGYYYEIEVERVRRENPPADASAYEHRLLRVIKRVKKEKDL